MRKNITFVIAALTIGLVGVAFYSSSTALTMEKTNQKKVNVWDTYVTKRNGETMHFDILAPIEIKDTAIIYRYGREYLKSKGQEGQPLTAKQCRLCHVEKLRPAWEKDIEEKGYFIIEMEGCE